MLYNETIVVYLDKECCSTHLIDGDGNFNVEGVDLFMKEVKLSECGLSYAVVAIMGPQSSGIDFFLYLVIVTDHSQCAWCEVWLVLDREEYIDESSVWY